MFDQKYNLNLHIINLNLALKSLSRFQSQWLHIRITQMNFKISPLSTLESALEEGVLTSWLFLYLQNFPLYLYKNVASLLPGHGAGFNPMGLISTNTKRVSKRESALAFLSEEDWTQIHFILKELEKVVNW